MSKLETNITPLLDVIGLLREKTIAEEATGDRTETNQLQYTLNKTQHKTDLNVSAVHEAVAGSLETWKKELESELKHLDNVRVELSRRDGELLETQKALHSVIYSIQAVGREDTEQVPATVVSSRRKRECPSSLSSACLSDPTRHLRTPTELAAPTEVKRPRLLSASESLMNKTSDRTMSEHQNGSSASESRDSLNSDFWTASGASTCPVDSFVEKGNHKEDDCDQN